jgi:phosphoribosylformylglycinamidine synthase PurS subunit
VEYLARVYVTPKSAILDPAGKAVAASLKTLGYRNVLDVRLGKYIEVRLEAKADDEATRRVAEMCERLLANGVIEEFRFEVEAQAR